MTAFFKPFLLHFSNGFKREASLGVKKASFCMPTGNKAVLCCQQTIKLCVVLPTNNKVVLLTDDEFMLPTDNQVVLPADNKVDEQVGWLM